MSIEELQQRTAVNIQEKANLIWAIADKLVGTYKPHEYGNVILPMCVIKRFSDTLAGTKERVIAKNKELDSKNIQVKDGFLRAASGYDFYNVSPFTFEGLLSDAENIADNFRSYLNHFSVNVIDVIEKFEFDKAGDAAGKYIMKTIQFAYDEVKGVPTKWEGPNGKMYGMINPKYYDAEGNAVSEYEKGKRYFCTFDIAIEGSVIEISANSFPGTYYVTGDTYARSEASGKDEFFQFIIPKAKVQSENTITLEAEGDPSVFNMNLRVMRPADGKMMKLVKYNLVDEGETAEDNVSIVHNHVLKTATEQAEG